MKIFQLKHLDTLSFSADKGVWETITFDAADFVDISMATANEVVQKINNSSSLAAKVETDGNLILETKSQGGHVSLEIDLARSTAAAALGITDDRANARGKGLCAARVVSLNTEPFSLSNKAEMTLYINGTKQKIVFDKAPYPNMVSAVEVATVINAKFKDAAHASNDGRVILTSRTSGSDSRIEVIPGAVVSGKVDAAAILGFTGHSALDHPNRVEPARVVCTEVTNGIQVDNLTTDLIELHLLSGIASLPPRGSLPLNETDVASTQLQRFIVQGKVRLAKLS